MGDNMPFVYVTKEEAAAVIAVVEKIAVARQKSVAEIVRDGVKIPGDRLVELQRIALGEGGTLFSAMV